MRGQFVERHIDQVFSDFVKPPEQVHDQAQGPVGTTDKYEILLSLYSSVQAIIS